SSTENDSPLKLSRPSTAFGNNSFPDGDSNGIPVASKIKRRHVVSQNKSYFPSTRRPHAGSDNSESGATTVHGWVSAPRLHARRAPRRHRHHHPAHWHPVSGPWQGAGVCTD